MNIPLPVSDGYTIYSKMNCIYCTKVKALLEDKQSVTIIPCDLFLEDRIPFLQFMDSITLTKHRTFPFVFQHGIFMGGYDDIKRVLENEISFTDTF